MFKFSKIFALSLLMLLGANAYAQDNTAETQTAETPAAAAPATDTVAQATPVAVTGEDIPLPDDAAPATDAAAQAPATDATAQAAPVTVTGEDIPLPDDAAAPATEAAANTATANTTTAADSAYVEPEVLTDALLDKRLREVSTHVDTLKEDTFTTKSRLLLLREEVLQRSVSGARLQIRHKNDMGGQYELVQVYYALDNEPVFSKQDMTGALDDIEDEIIYDRMLAPGQHQLTVLYVYKGKAWGVFRYMKDYTFRVQSGYDFNVEEGKASELVVTASEKDGAFIPYEDRPSVTYNYEQFDLMPSTMLDEEATVASSEGAE